MNLNRREFFAITAFDWLLPWKWFRGDPTIAGIRFHEIRKGDRRRYLWIHGDEVTAREVLSRWMENGANGRAFFIHSDQRNVSVEGGSIDPNRMWSRSGAEASLRSLNPEWSGDKIRDVLNKLDEGREGVLRRILPSSGQVLIVLHNNGPAYSVKDETGISDAVAMQAPESPDEFMLCTSRVDFELLAGGPFNVVLQHKAPPSDDGSLSRLCAARNVRYVNIEAAHGNAEGQRRMLEWAEAVLL
jgi:hypothetical protein